MLNVTRSSSVLGLFLVILGLTLAMERASSGEPDWSRGMPCGDVADLYYFYDDCRVAYGDVDTVCDEAIDELMWDMSESTFLICAACEGIRCRRTAILLSSPITTEVAYDPILELWTCTACFDGVYEGMCSYCP